MNSSKSAVVLYDGVCNFCNATVNFILARDPSRYFYFAALQSPKGRELLSSAALPSRHEDLSTLVLLENDQAFTKSTAALRIARRLRAPWPLLYILIFVPRAIRNAAYDALAKRRYRWFGKQKECPLPPPEVRERFLDAQAGLGTHSQFNP